MHVNIIIIHTTLLHLNIQRRSFILLWNHKSHSIQVSNIAQHDVTKKQTSIAKRIRFDPLICGLCIDLGTTLYFRVAEHAGRNFRTSSTLTVNSHILLDHFMITGSTSSNVDLRMLENHFYTRTEARFKWITQCISTKYW